MTTMEKSVARKAGRGGLKLHPDDNVVVSIDTLVEGSVVEGIPVNERVSRGHKMALCEITEGSPIFKYGQIIGYATQNIHAGNHVHVHNCAMGSVEVDYRTGLDARPVTMVPEAKRSTFDGYRRKSGKVGTRNYLGILTSVNCSASVARLIAREAERSGLLDQYPHVDGVVPLVHGTGCGMDVKGEGFDAFERVLWGHATHPNFASILMVGLGCEVFQIPRLKERYGVEEGTYFRSFTIQESGGTKATIERALAVIEEMLPGANEVRREPCTADAITLALQCGGSDGYSGITANPALGIAADLLVAQGGTAILAETPEIYGAEHLLTARAASPEIAEKLLSRIRWWEEYTARNGMEMNNNPSPGNKAGGLTTILEKSLGAAAKGGSTPLEEVYLYGEQARTKGFVFMDSPGYDPVSVTGQVAAGSNVVAFTTGRGSAYGCKPSPSIKLATNSPLYERMGEDMDINCGDILDGVSLAEKGQEIFEKVLKVASGERTKSEALGYGDAEFVPWQIGAVM